MLEEVLQRELAAHHAQRVFFRLLLVDDFFEILDQADNVTHTEHATGHALRTEGLELVGGLAHTGE